MNEAKRAKLHDVADSLRWLADKLDQATEGDGEAAGLVRCFCHDWCGMVAVGPVVLMADIEDVLAEGEAAIAALQADAGM